METTVKTEEKKEVEIPLGQRILKAGYKRITEEDLRERFCCKQITQKEKDKTVAEFAKNNPRFKIRLVGENYSEGFFVYSKGFWNQQKYLTHDSCTIKTVSLDEYVEDIIPERCLESIEKAKIKGFKKFEVAFPVIGPAPQADPVIVGHLSYEGGDMFEIDMWE